MTTFPTQLEMKKKFSKVFTAEQTASLVDTIDVVQQAERERAADIRDLKRGQAKLTAGQAKLTAGQAKLTAGQAKLTAGQAKLTAEVATLTTGQAKLTVEVAGLTVAQQQTNERIDNLTKEMRTEFKEIHQEIDGIHQDIDEIHQDIDEIKQDIGEIKQEIGGIHQAIDRLNKTVGGLGNTIGFNLEEFVSFILPPYLENQVNITDVVFDRNFFEEKDGGQLLEVDLISNGQRDGQPVLILVECKTSIGGGEMRRIAKKMDSIAADITDKEVFKIVVAMNLHPTGDAAASETGIWAIPYRRINRAYYQ